MIDGDSLLLRQLPYFRNFRPEEPAVVRSHVRPRNLAADEVILLEGQPAEALYVVCRGRVRIFQSTAAPIVVVWPDSTDCDKPTL